MVKNNIINGHNDVIICGAIFLRTNVSAVVITTIQNKEIKNILCLDFIIFCFRF